MHPHRQISVYADAEIADGLHWSDADAVNQHSWDESVLLYNGQLLCGFNVPIKG